MWHDSKFNIPADTQQNISGYLDAAFLDLAEKHCDVVSDERSSVHLQVRLTETPVVLLYIVTPLKALMPSLSNDR